VRPTSALAAGGGAGAVVRAAAIRQGARWHVPLSLEPRVILEHPVPLSTTTLAGAPAVA
jgi:hypothetical protein